MLQIDNLNHAGASEGEVLGKAVLRVATSLGLTQADLGAVIGKDRTQISRLKQNPSLKPESKSGELALLLIRLARSLYVLAGGDDDWIKHFIHSPNKVTGGVPAEQIKTVAGLVKVLNFVDALRGKV